MAYEVVWDGTPRTSRYLLQDDAPTRPAPPVPDVPDAIDRIGRVLSVLSAGPLGQLELVRLTGLTENQVNATVGYLRRRGRIAIAGAIVPPGVRGPRGQGGEAHAPSTRA